MNTNEVFAQNVFSMWTKLIKQARFRVTIFSPYVDNTVIDLFAKNRGEGMIFQLITRVDSDTILEKPYQIKTLIKCVKKKYIVKHLDSLHAKILVVDGKFVSIGSQNFTARGKLNKEVSLVSKDSFEKTILLKNLDEWVVQSEIVNLEFLIELNSKLTKYKKSIVEIKKNHEREFNKIKNKIKRTEELLLNLRELKDEASLSFLNDNVYIERKWIDRTDLYGNNYSIGTFLVDSGNNLLHWRDLNAQNQIKHLNRLSYYPLINTENSSVAFVRLGATRISFFLNQRQFGYFEFSDDYFANVKISFPIEETDKINVCFKISFTNSIVYEGSHEAILSYYFDGKKFELVKKSYDDSKSLNLINKYILNSKKNENDFISKIFVSWRPDSHGNPIGQFLRGGAYKIYIVQFQNNPILALEKI